MLRHDRSRSQAALQHRNAATAHTHTLHRSNALRALSVTTSALPQPRPSVLRDAVVRPSTSTLYDTAVTKFIDWCTAKSIVLSSVEHIDDILSQYIDELHTLRLPKYLAAHTLCGIAHFYPRSRYLLTESRMRVKGWDRLVPSVSHPPLTWEITVAMAYAMAHRRLYDYAVATLLGFDCYLRVGELCSIRCSDVAQPADPRVGAVYQGMALRIATAKTGVNQWVTVRDSGVQQLLQERVTSKPGRRCKLFPFTQQQYSRVFAAIRNQLELSHIPYVPHSLRHGGATADALRGVSMNDILLRGRWVSTTSATIYVQTGRALLLTLDVPISVHQLGTEVLAAGLYSSFMELRVRYPELH